MVSSEDELEKIRKWDDMYCEMVHELRGTYDSQLPKYQIVRDRAELVLRTKIEKCKIRCDVTSRIKDLASVRTRIGLRYDELRAKYQKAIPGSESSIRELLKKPFLKYRISLE